MTLKYIAFDQLKGTYLCTMLSNANLYGFKPCPTPPRMQVGRRVLRIIEDLVMHNREAHVGGTAATTGQAM
jgi:hypothetical protein